MDYNPFLKPAAAASRGTVEKRENIPWQHRAEPPGEFENRLGDALVQVFASGAESLPDVVKASNAILRDRSGQPWTEASFEAEMKRLGA